MTSWLYFRQKQHTSYYTCKFPLFLKDDHLDLESLKKAASDLVTPGTTNNAWFNYFTCNHAPPPPPHTHTHTGHLQFFLFQRSIPHPRVHRKRQFPTPKHLIDLIYNFFNIFFICTKAKQHIFTTFMNVFLLSLLRER